MGKGRWVSALVAVVGLAILVVLFNFNKHHWVDDEYLVTNIAALFWLPMVLILLVFRQEPTTFGFAVGDVGKGYRFALICFLLLLPALIYLAPSKGFQDCYPMDKRALNSLADLCRFELVYGVYLFCWEFFFRGFLLFGLQRSLGWWSILVQAIPFGIMHFGKPELIWAFPGGVILGYLAYKSKSFMPCFVLHWAVSITMDVLVVVMGRGLLS